METSEILCLLAFLWFCWAELREWGLPDEFKASYNRKAR
jgi:hypothetical protein